MITIIHGGHREGLCFSAAKTLEQLLKEQGTEVKLYDLRNGNFGYCCGEQPCQDSRTCIYEDYITNEVIPTIAQSDGLIFFTPTYFNMPPAILKNFIDRCNLLLTIKDRRYPKFGAWVSGQTEIASIESCYQGIATFCEICELMPFKSGMMLRIEIETTTKNINQDDVTKLKELAKEILE
ncbi:MAG: flavodoxin family protein [Fibromonadales bacterium]|nr:flavodoxin family protein [Fibromonadales bacterium]